MARLSPLAQVKDRFADKATLVAAVKALATEELWIGRTSADRGHERGLEHVSNAKLLRLHAVFTEVKEKHGTREALINAILELTHSTKDEGMKKRLQAFPVPRLNDLYKTAAKQAKAAAKKAAPAAK